MKKSNRKHNAVMVNSLKGGCGKTTIALSICVSAAMEDGEKYNNIYYFDIDVAGTGSFYKLFGNGSNNKLLDYYGTKKCIECVNLIELKDPNNNDLSYYFNAISIDPKTRIDKKSYKNGTIRFEPVIEEDNFIGNIIDFIKLLNENEDGDEKKNLYVFDCSPGLNRLQCELVCKLKKIKSTKVNEMFVTSYDNSHINKTVECLAEYYISEGKTEKMNILINDIHNIKDIENSKGYNFDDIIENVRKKNGKNQSER